MQKKTQQKIKTTSHIEKGQDENKRKHRRSNNIHKQTTSTGVKAINMKQTKKKTNFFFFFLEFFQTGVARRETVYAFLFLSIQFFFFVFLFFFFCTERERENEPFKSYVLGVVCMFERRKKKRSLARFYFIIFFFLF